MHSHAVGIPTDFGIHRQLLGSLHRLARYSGAVCCSRGNCLCELCQLWPGSWFVVLDLSRSNRSVADADPYSPGLGCSRLLPAAIWMQRSAASSSYSGWTRHCCSITAELNGSGEIAGSLWKSAIVVSSAEHWALDSDQGSNNGRSRLRLVW